MNRIYKWLLGSPVSRTAARKPQRSVLGVHQMEDRVVPTAIPTVGSNGLPLELVSTLAVQMANPDHAGDSLESTRPTTTVDLANGVEYFVVAYNGIGVDEPYIAKNAYSKSDAEFIRWDHPNGPYDTSTGSNPVEVGIRLAGGVQVPSPDQNFWGTYQSDHTYVQTVTGTGSKANAYFSGLSNSTWDNKGIVYVDVYREQLPTVSVSTSTPTVAEAPGQYVDFVIELSNKATQLTTVEYKTPSVFKATPGFDYTWNSGTATFNVGEDTYAVRVDIADDTIGGEGDETFQMELFNPVGATVGTGSQLVVIQDDDALIAGVVWADRGGDGIRESDEDLIVGAEMQLLDSNGVLVANSYSDVDGKYSFTIPSIDSIGASGFKVHAVNSDSDGYTLTAYQIGSPEFDNDASMLTDTIGEIVLPDLLPGQILASQDVGYISTTNGDTGEQADPPAAANPVVAARSVTIKSFAAQMTAAGTFDAWAADFKANFRVDLTNPQTMTKYEDRHLVWRMNSPPQVNPRVAQAAIWHAARYEVFGWNNLANKNGYVIQLFELTTTLYDKVDKATRVVVGQPVKRYIVEAFEVDPMTGIAKLIDQHTFGNNQIGATANGFIGLYETVVAAKIGFGTWDNQAVTGFSVLYDSNTTKFDETKASWILQPQVTEIKWQFTAEGGWYFRDATTLSEFQANYDKFTTLEHGNVE